MHKRMPRTFEDNVRLKQAMKWMVKAINKRFTISSGSGEPATMKTF